MDNLHLIHSIGCETHVGFGIARRQNDFSVEG